MDADTYSRLQAMAADLNAAGDANAHAAAADEAAGKMHDQIGELRAEVKRRRDREVSLIVAKEVEHLKAENALLRKVAEAAEALPLIPRPTEYWQESYAALITAVREWREAGS